MIAALIVIAASQGVTAKIPLEPCVLQGRADVTRLRAECGAIDVPLFDASADAAQRTVSIGFALLKARDREPLPDPVVFLAGGPGQASTALAPLVSRVLDKVRQRRNLVFFDARGTGRSGAFDCDDPRPAVERAATSLLEVTALREACLKNAVIDPTAITTERIARDLEALRIALGAEQLNLVGASYGTRLALVYDRLFPGRVRAMVLDGLAPPTMIVGETLRADVTAALAALDARCAARVACTGGGAPPSEIVAALMKQPPGAVTVLHPTTGISTTAHVSDRAIAGVVQSLLYSEEGAALLIPILRQAAGGDWLPFATQVLLGEKSEHEIDGAMHASILCAEEVPFYSDSVDQTPSPFPDIRDEMKKVCALWPHATVDKSFHNPVSSPTVALLLSGTNDPVTPPARGDDAKARLPNATHHVVSGVSHGVFFRGCAPEMVAAFIATADTGKVDGSCTQRMGPFPLFIDRMGP